MRVHGRGRAAYASYRHGREFAERFGADATTAAIWPLIVDGLFTMVTVELWNTTGRARCAGGRRGCLSGWGSACRCPPTWPPLRR
ncbi:DUF2637 domain-containing protein [Amycolatopsis alkalitolerans]|uniref:DUF2637 domain-containing protein n=1 Tax=Amycolatopsis alkalitolerans TaxID=2547244 RepID=UPI001F22A674|nr:DUF2637 domain-containing protein [Amycolatopsis alkalitolerans]